MERINMPRDKVIVRADDPLKILSFQLNREPGLTISFDLLNTSDRGIIEAEFCVSLLDKEGMPISQAEDLPLHLTSVTIPPHSKFKTPSLTFETPYEYGTNAIVAVNGFVYDDGNRWKPTETGDPYELEEISEELRRNLQVLFGEEAYTYARIFEKTWQCICGNYNINDTDNCEFCQRAKEIVLSKLTKDPVQARIAQSSDSDLAFRSTVDLTNLPDEVERVLAEEALQEEEYVEQKKKILRPSLLKGLIAFIVIGVSLYVGMSLYRDYQLAKQEAQADEMVASKEYVSAIATYEKILESRPSEKVKAKLEVAETLQVSQRAYNDGMKLAEEGDLEGGLRRLLEVTTDDANNYEQAQGKIAELKEQIIANIREKMVAEDFGASRVLLDRLKLILPSDETVAALATEIDEEEAKKIEEDERLEEQRLAELERAKAEAKAAQTAAKAAQSAASLQAQASELMNTMQYVVIEGSNVREGPNTSSKIIAKLPKGSYVSVYNTSIESGKRVWCYGQLINADTGSSIYGWISNENLRSSL